MVLGFVDLGADAAFHSPALKELCRRHSHDSEWPTEAGSELDRLMADALFTLHVSPNVVRLALCAQRWR
jgi:hypothetical protein